MTQSSRPQADNQINGYDDAGPYSRDQWAQRIRAAHTGDTNTASSRTRIRGPVPTFDNMLCTIENTPDILVSTGAGIVYGSYLFNSVAVTFTPAAAAANSHYDLVCMVENNTNAAVATDSSGNTWQFPNDLTDYDGANSVPAYTARLVIISGADAPAPAVPTLDQLTTLYCVEIARYTINNAGVIAGFSDTRNFSDIETIVGVYIDDNGSIEDAAIIGTVVNNDDGADNLGVGIRAKLENDAGALEDAARIAFRWTDSADGSEDAREERRLSAGNALNLGFVQNAPTAASADGNARGIGAIDQQQARNAVTQVASGTYATLSGGYRSTASGNYSAVCGGSTNTASGAYAIALAGAGNVASGDYSIAGCNGGVASGDWSVALGNVATASKDYATALGTAYSTLYGQVSHANGYFASQSDVQGTIQMVASITTAGASAATELFLDGDTASERMIIPASTAWTYDILIAAISTAAAHYASFRAYGMIERDAANNTTIHSTTGVVTETASGGQTATVTADDANESLLIQFDDNGAAIHRVVATIRLAQVSKP